MISKNTISGLKSWAWMRFLCEGKFNEPPRSKLRGIYNCKERSKLRGIYRERLKNWLREQIQSVLSKPVEPAPFILWCNPAREWKELLQKICDDNIELWVEEGHELLLRHRFAREERCPRVIWLPK